MVFYNENSFFKEATLRICGTLDIEIALWKCLTHLRDIMPADMMALILRECDFRLLRTMARADLSGARRLDDLIPVPVENRELLRQMGSTDIMIINDTSKNPVSHLWHTYYGDPICSSLLMTLRMDEEDVGGVVLQAYGKDRYTKEHADLYLQLKGPFAIALSNALKHQELVEIREILADENRYLRRRLQQLSGDKIIGESRSWKAVMEMVHLIGPLDSPVLLLGETGVGKEIAANAIHMISPRKDFPFVKVNCGALPESLLDSALFGHEKGAFTGAVGSRKGLFERADQGTLFFDEIGDMPLHVQVRLLRVLQNKELERVGGTTTIPVDTRIIAASQRDLGEMVMTNQFRADLWYRLNVFPITIPPLRERKEDIPALVQHFVKRKARVLKLARSPELSPGAIDTLLSHDWPGNVRELENVVERAVILSRGAPLDFVPLLPARGQDDLLPPAGKRQTNLRLDRIIRPCISGNSALPPPGERQEISELDRLVRDHIQHTLEITHGKIHGPGGAAETLGINPNTLRSRMRKLGIPYKRQDRPSSPVTTR
ncbi:MAG: sigma 54-interacting transcriptional regulator [Thermodesulfobacteriota bacterium]